jgi:hypothetical protein
MSLKLVDDVQIVDPLSVAIYPPHVGVSPALLADFALEQAIIHCILHLGYLLQLGQVGGVVQQSQKVAARRTRQASLGIAWERQRLSQAVLVYGYAGCDRRNGHACRRSLVVEASIVQFRRLTCL